ncbi:OpgC domain-containing protein [Bradyrhizobium prioriisuperbiae]|uniref:OpgC domain-containing protein n=1 Tax=Bradyrhizobium prioriisuperbiae TaxID=2854389 RepID=UPI0028F104FC|nr:OpgC domain-containing protein [Bradyrhizobium prioritasuperba]
MADTERGRPTGSADGRDLRLDLFRGIANWAIFLNHIPDTSLIWLTTRNYGFSDAADLFVFISGYSAAYVYARSMRTNGFIEGAVRLLKRVWQIYVAHVLLFVVYVAAIGWVAQTYGHSHLLNEFNVAVVIEQPIAGLTQGLLLKFKPLNLDVLPLYIVLMAPFPLALWAMIRRPDLVLGASFVLYVAARLFSWNLSAYPSGSWFFNPFTWQFPFILGAWCALGGAARIQKAMQTRAVIWICAAYLLFALLIMLSDNFAPVARIVPSWLSAAFLPIDKTNLGPSRVLHFLALAVLVTAMLPRQWPGLKSRWLWPLIICGQHSLEVFCVGIFLSFVAHFLLELISTSLAAQALVGLLGFAILTAVAAYRGWSKRLEKRRA